MSRGRETPHLTALDERSLMLATIALLALAGVFGFLFFTLAYALLTH